MIMRKNDTFDAKIVNTRLTKIFIAFFAPDERLPSSATLIKNKNSDRNTRCLLDFLAMLMEVNPILAMPRF